MKLNIQLFADAVVVIGTEIDTSGAEKDADKLKKLLEHQNFEEHLFDEINEEADKTQKNIEDKIEETKKTIEEIPTKVDKSFNGILKKITKWGLALFGIRSAYSLILSSANRLASENTDMANKLTAIKNSLGNLIAPVAEVIVNLVYRLLSYLNVITKSFLNIDLFKKSEKSVKKTTAGAKSLKKTMAQFDEMNVVGSKNGGAGGTAGAGGSGLGETDVSKFQEIVDKYKKMWNELLETSRTEMAKMLLQQDTTWGLLKLGWFDIIQGIVFFITGLVDTIKSIFTIIKGIALGDTEMIKEGIVSLLESLVNILRGIIQTILGVLELAIGAIWGLIKSIYDNVVKPVALAIAKVFVDVWNGLVNGAKSAWNGIKSVFSKVATFFKDTFTKAWNGIKALFSKGGQIFVGIKDGIVNAFKSIVNALITGINAVIGTPFKAINKMLNKIHNVDILGLRPFEKLWSLDPIKVPQIPKLAKGGIINMPGRGVPVAYGGERGQEGVIPLTDSQQMALLGEAIGKYITINANITNTMNGRIISRELQKINNENNFASNR